MAFAAVTLGQTSVADIARGEQARLNACISLAETDAETAYEDSLRWLGEGARPAARYCQAMALIGLGNYREAAAGLEELANAENSGSLQDRAIYLAQSGNAWLAAGYLDAAVVTLTNALKLAPEDAGIRADRAAAYLGLEQWEEALADLDMALTKSPNSIDALQMRARAHLNLDQLDKAELDVNKALLLDRKNLDTLVLRGDVREAKRLAGK